MRWIALAAVLVGVALADEGRAVWVQPCDISSPDAIDLLIRNLKRANIKLIFVCVKDIRGRIIWHSERFSDAVHPDFRHFDGLNLLLQRAHKANIRVHAWFCCLTESPESPVVKKHPEWQQKNPNNQPTTSEIIQNNRKYNIVWMCPARRPGYVDRYLIPMMVELLKKYPVDGIHYDYLRYPGDVAPDRYCFCDWCSQHIFRHAHMFYENFPDKEFAPQKPLLPRAAANWLKDYTIRPPRKTWKNAPSTVKAEFLLRGSTLWRKIPLHRTPNPCDMDFFFYTYRCDAIKRSLEEAHKAAIKVRPDIVFSATVFKNPVLAARFCGQKWTDFLHLLDVVAPMLYRSYFPDSSFSEYLTMLSEYVRMENYWVGGNCHTYCAISVKDLYKEERREVERLAALLCLTGDRARQEKALDSLALLSGEALSSFLGKMRKTFSAFSERLKRCSVQLFNDFEKCFATLQKAAKEGGETKAIFRKLRHLTALLLNDPPPNFYPPKKLTAAINALRKARTEGIALFCASSITRFKLWDALAKSFKQPSELPHLAKPVSVPSTQVLRLLHLCRSELKQSRNENRQLVGKLASANAKIGALSDKVAKLTQQIKDLLSERNKALRQLKDAIQKAKKELDDLKARLQKEIEAKKRSRQKVEKLEKELAAKEGVLKTLRSRLKAAQDEADLLRKQNRRALLELQDYRQKVIETEKRFESQRYYERLRLVIAFGVAVIAFAVALIATMLKRKSG